MNGDLGLWSEPYFGVYSSTIDNDLYVESGDVEFDIHCSSLTTDPPDTMGFVHSMSTDVLHAAPFSNTRYVHNAPYLPPGNMSTSQRLHTNQHLCINTQLGPNQINDPDSSTASSSSFRQALQTPCFQFYPTFQPSVRICSPQSASAESGMLILDLEKMSPLPASPLGQYSSRFEGDKLDTLTSPLLIEPDVATQSPMPHILEWKRVMELCGTNDFVPQAVYQPYTEADRKRYIRDVELQETIFFGSDDTPELGISLEDALKQRLRHLKDKEDSMFVGCGPSVSIRIQWPGYPSWSKQIPTMDFKTPKGPITRAKLAKNIATCIRRFSESVQDKPMEAESDRRWKIGNHHIRVEDLILVSLHHVSKGSWQPQLRLRRPYTTFPYHWDEFLSPLPVS